MHHAGGCFKTDLCNIFIFVTVQPLATEEGHEDVQTEEYHNDRSTGSIEEQNFESDNNCGEYF